ncbi:MULTISPECIES: peptidoglycan bridge formation glycyltransferase FemA/FemB family protein [unclassified Streptomyces]|uniref:lipid II:glycine glycyltransferase FemX n=1 Tax=unclassified Streptomyces TaxID=2593676 RepID=UPI000DBAD5EC|nr:MULTISPECIES: peptidoglycan bridge formation glycyltransferase FemA/FemB family protein [unclassified Streptomyces]MYT72567.1 peptidoglycan bridge formation glycyltransferase FemA/FemB family protein [Streptomyces sp. SID8367]RAJ79424.1 lipid II:glycine glycyltransferase (peptidoglycan interpeptide bridge formation enzyme) [Streptomyces sp. PsTaAH-137]
MTSQPALSVRAVSRAEHLAHRTLYPGVSHLQIPEWGAVKPDWEAESVGWFEGPSRVAAALVLYRALPGTRRTLAYLPDGPSLDWTDPRLGRWLEPLIAHVTRRGAFSLRIGPPLVVRQWEPATVAEGIADSGVRHLHGMAADHIDGIALQVGERLRRLGWRPCADGDDAGFGVGQPRYGCQVPLAERSAQAVRSGLAPHWQEALDTSEAAGVRVTWGSDADLPAFHRLYAETAARDGFKARPVAYFERMWQALNTDDGDRLRLYLAERDGEALSAALMISVGQRFWHSYAASGSRGRELRSDHALLWRMLGVARAAGADTYDLRAVSPLLTEDNRLLDRLRFKTGAGGRAVEYLGEWELPVGPQGRVLQRALGFYLGHR